MSVRVMSMVWASSLPPNERLVLLAYADHANDDGQSIWPGRDAMAAKTGYSENHVRKITRSLKARGVLIQVADGHRGRRAEYRIDLEALTDLKGGREGPPIDEAKGTHSDQKGYSSGPQRVPIRTGKGTHRDRPYISEPSVNRPEPSSSADESAIESAISTQRDAVWDWLVDRFGLPVDTDTQQARVGRCVRELRAQVDAQTGVQSRTADPLEAEHVARLLDQRARNWPAHYPDATLTPEAYVKHFHALARPPLRVSADDQRRAEVQAAIAGLKEEA